MREKYINFLKLVKHKGNNKAIKNNQIMPILYHSITTNDHLTYIQD